MGTACQRVSGVREVGDVAEVAASSTKSGAGAKPAVAPIGRCRRPISAMTSSGLSMPSSVEGRGLPLDVDSEGRNDAVLLHPCEDFGRR